MDVTVRLFAGLRERAGTATLELELADDAHVADALAALSGLTAETPVVMAVNREYADAGRQLHPGDELALIPPVSGGADTPDAGDGPRTPERVHARLREDPLSLDDLVGFVADPRAGAVVTFSGVTRDVPALEYEAYAEMARAQLSRIAAQAVTGHGLCAAAVEHRTGTVALGEASVLIAVSAPHRAEAFAGGREIIDAIKALAPIWKREAGVWRGDGLPAAEPPNG